MGFLMSLQLGGCARLLSLLGLFEFYDTVFELRTSIKVHLELAACQIHSVLKL
jgi:hypothetical protein